MTTQQPESATVANSLREWRQLLDSDARIVRTADDWHELLRSKDNPLAGYDEEVTGRFTESLVFNNGGLAGVDYSAIADVVTFRTFRRLLEAFGIGLGLFADYDGYMCESRGTCKKMHERICTSNC